MNTANDIVRTAIANNSEINFYVLVSAALSGGAIEIDREVIDGMVQSVLFWPSFEGIDGIGRELRARYVAPPPHGLTDEKIAARAAFIAAEKAALGID